MGPATSLTVCQHVLCTDCRRSLRGNLCPICRSELPDDASVISGLRQVAQPHDNSDASSSDSDGIPMTHMRAMRPQWREPIRRSDDDEEDFPGAVLRSEEAIGDQPQAWSLRSRTDAFPSMARRSIGGN